MLLSCLESALLHAMNHLQAGYQGKNVQFFITDTSQNTGKCAAKWSTGKRNNRFEWSETLTARSQQTGLGKSFPMIHLKFVPKILKAWMECSCFWIYIHPKLTCNMHFKTETKYNFNVVQKCPWIRVPPHSLFSHLLQVRVFHHLHNTVGPLHTILKNIDVGASHFAFFKHSTTRCTQAVANTPQLCRSLRKHKRTSPLPPLQWAEPSCFQLSSRCWGAMWIKEESCKLDVTQEEFLLDITHILPTPFFCSTMPEVQQSFFSKNFQLWT